MSGSDKTARIKQTLLDHIRILVIEDNPVDREIIKGHLEFIGLTNIQMAVDGTEGIFKITNAEKAGSPFQIVITDWKMPKKDGISVITSLKKRAYFKQYTIMVTSIADETNVVAALGAGVDDYILKPIDASIFTKKVYGIVDRIQKSKSAS